MKLQPFSMSRWVGAALVAVVTAAVGNVARAGDVRWSVGAHVAPGVVVHAGNARPYYYAPPPVYVAPAPVYYAPAPVYYSNGYYPAYYGTTVVYGGGHRHHGHRHHHRRHRR